MDRTYTEQDEFSFDDNGLQNIFLLVSRQEIVSSECINEGALDDPNLSHCDAITPRRYENKVTKIDFDEIESHESAHTVSNYRRDSHGCAGRKYNSEIPFCHSVKKEGAEKVDGRSNLRAEEAREAKFISGRSAKDGGCQTCSGDQELLSLLASFWATSIAMLYSKFLVPLAVGILFLMPSAGIEGALTSVPINTLSVVGHTVRMNCSTDLNRSVYWTRTLVGYRVQQWLYYGKNGFNGNNADRRFSMDKDEAMGRYDIIISDVEPGDVGQYVCVDDSGIGVKASAELVLSDPISCKSHIPIDGVMGYNVFGIEQDLIHFSCSLTYTGNISPTLDWSWPGSEMEGDEPMVSVSTSSITSAIKISPTKEEDNRKFQCKASIEGATRTSIDSGLMWESEPVNVRYAEFGSQEVDMCPGIRLNLFCSPRCSYQFERKDQGCQCLYVYFDTRTQRKYQVASDVIKCSDNDNKPQVVIIIVIVAAFVIVGLAIPISVYCLTMAKAKRLLADDSGKSDPIRDDDNPGTVMIESA